MGRDQFTSTGRIESFSDGVIAIIITIMILEFRLPENALDQGLWLGIVKPTAPKIMSYALSFLMLTQMWIGHHALMHNARYATPILMWCNNNVLFWMSMIPFSTMILGSHPFAPTAVALYGLTLALTAASFTFLRWLVMKQNDFHGEILTIFQTAQKRSIIAMLLFLFAIPTAFLSVYVSLVIYLCVPLMIFTWHVWLTRMILSSHRKPDGTRHLKRR
jgi:TMEM175 potassium channel family protein